jgi:aldehyde:ferredoxin oxidoreductase
MLRDVPQGADPLSPENALIFAASPLTGLPMAGLSRVVVAARSPLTGGIGDSQAGGFLPAELKANGYDAIIFRGKSEKPVYLHIKDGDAQLKPADHLWGRTTGEADDILREENGAALEIAQIGPAGENLVRFACIVHNCSRANGRTGNGAVMGSKNLRALVVSHADKPRPTDPEAFSEIGRRLLEKLSDPFWRDFKTLGTAGNIKPLREMGYLPTRNFKSGWFPDFPETGSEGGGACYACPISCKRVAKKSEKVDPRYGGPEYETIAALGSYCGISSQESINISNQLCNMYGMDTISCGATIAFAMECAEHGLLPARDTGEFSLSFGDSDAVQKLTVMIATRKGVGDLLAEGSQRAAEMIGGDALRFVVTSKGQELPAHMPQLKPSMGLIYAVNPFGADHQSSEHDTMLAAPPGSSIRQWLAVLGVDPDRRIRKGKADGRLDEFSVSFAIQTQYFYSLLDTLCMCQFVWGPSWQALGPKDLLDLCASGIGWDATVPELMKIGERRLNMMRYFNAREGFTKKDDTLPERFFKPLPDGPAIGAYVDRDAFREGRELYYSLAGWDNSTGNPTREKLESLSLGWLPPMTAPCPTDPAVMSAVVLAGGKSLRMGTDKALLKWREKNFLETLLYTLSMFRSSFVSTADKTQYKTLRYRTIPDLYPGIGPVGGIYASLLASDDDYLFVTACDTPFMSADLIRELCRAAEGYDCCIARERDGRLHPLCGVYGRSMIPVFRKQIDDGRYKIAIAYEKVKTRYFDLSPRQAAELKNFNTRQEYLDMMESLNETA